MKSLVRSALLLVSVTALVALTGCAPTSVNVLSQYTGPLPQPNRILVYNFAVSPDEVTLNQGISAEVQALAGNPQPPWSEKELQVGHAVSNALAGKLAAQLRSLGYPADRAAGSPGGRGGNVLVIEGQITSVNQGNQAARVVIGLGVGHSDVKTFTQAYDLQPYGRRLIEQFSTDARSGFKPGMAETEGASAAAGHWAVGLAVGAGLSVASEAFSANVEADADRTATEVAQHLNNYFLSRGWAPAGAPQ
jgi:hypothetical protein